MSDLIKAFISASFEQTKPLTSNDITIESILYTENTRLINTFNDTHFQDGLIWKNVNMAINLARIIVPESTGEVNKHTIEQIISYLENKLYPIAHNRKDEKPHREHILKVLKLLISQKNLILEIKSIVIPTHSAMQNIIQNTLNLPQNTQLTVAHVRQAVISSMLCFLRQDVGSCFATAIALLIQQQKPEFFIDDISQLMLHGHISRTYNSRSIIAPINTMNGIGDLFKPVFVQDLGANPLQTIANAPGIIKALESTDIELDVLSLISAPDICALLKNKKGTITANDILSGAILYYFNVSQQSLDMYLESQNHRPSSDIIITEHKSSKSNAISNAFSALQIAKNTFINITRNRLLKAWEFTLASLSESHADFSKAHLISSLGACSEDLSGIKSTLSQAIFREASILKEESDSLLSQYNHIKSQLTYIETRLRSPLNNQDASTLTTDLKLRKQELDRTVYELDESREREHLMAGMESFILKFIIDAIPNFFKGLYDANMATLISAAYADVPAGFRIFYTHGRYNPLTWTPIYSSQEFISSLSSFLSFLETELLDKNKIRTIKKEVSRCIGFLITHIQSNNFLLSSFERLSLFYQQALPQNPLDNIHLILHKPWSYISGGTVEALITCYFMHDKPLSIIKKSPETPSELLAFFTDLIKDLPGIIKYNYLSNEDSILIAKSPSHVFRLQPSNPMFKDAWDNDWYSYTWLRDVWAEKFRIFFREINLDHHRLHFLIEKISTECLVNTNLTALLKDEFSEAGLSISDFYQKLMKLLSIDYLNYLNQDIEKLESKICSLLYSTLPVTSEQQLNININNISKYLSLNDITYEKYEHVINLHVKKYSLLSSEDIRRIYKAILMMHLQTSYVEEDMHARIANAMRYNFLAFPSPLIIGDSNWENKSLGFTIHPGSNEMDFWWFDVYGTSGKPITDTSFATNSRYFNEWAVFTDPREYGFIIKASEMSN